MTLNFSEDGEETSLEDLTEINLSALEINSTSSRQKDQSNEDGQCDESFEEFMDR